MSRVGRMPILVPDGVKVSIADGLFVADGPKGRVSERQLESAAFTVFLYGRMIGSAAEIDDHTNRGRNMDTRTPASKVVYVG